MYMYCISIHRWCIPGISRLICVQKHFQLTYYLAGGTLGNLARLRMIACQRPQRKIAASSRWEFATKTSRTEGFRALQALLSLCFWPDLRPCSCHCNIDLYCNPCCYCYCYYFCYCNIYYRGQKEGPERGPVQSDLRGSQSDQKGAQ